MTSKTFKKMYNLRLLKFHASDFEDFCKVHFPDEGLTFHSNKLRYLHWYMYPSKSLPSNFCPENLVELSLPRSNVEQLWEGVQVYTNIQMDQICSVVLSNRLQVSEILTYFRDLYFVAGPCEAETD